MPVHNYSPGPAVLPAPVAQELAEASTNFADTGLSLAETSHRAPVFAALRDRLESRIRGLLDLDSDYSVLLCAGGARTQFALVPFNLGGPGHYFVNGHWSRLAERDAAALTNSKAVQVGYSIPDVEVPQGGYVYYTPNETVDGIAFPEPPATDNLLVADASSCLFATELDLQRHAVVFACAQKNFGTAGLCLVLCRQALLERCPSEPTMLSWSAIAKASSLQNTPDTLAWFVADRYLHWVEAQGGVTALAKRNAARAQRIYALIDAWEGYQNNVPSAWRSRMNVCFRLADEGLEKPFLAEAARRQMIGLTGHRAVGGMRASLYNGLSESSFLALAELLEDFARDHG